MIKLKEFVFCVVALMVSLVNPKMADAQGPYRLPAADFSTLSSPSNYSVYTGVFNGRKYSLNYLVYNSATSRLAGGKTVPYYLGPLLPGVQIGGTDQCAVFGQAE